MRRLVALSILLLTFLPVSAEDWITADGKTYKDVTVLDQEEDGVRITYLGGVGKIPYYQLPVDIQKRFGQDLDSLAAKKNAADQALNEALGSAEATAEKKQQDDAAAAQMQKSSQGNNAAQANTQPGSNAPTGLPPQSGAHAQAGPNASATPSPGIPRAEPQTPSPLAPPAPAETAYAGSKLTYNDARDVCYLESPTVYVRPDPPPDVPSAPGLGTSLTLKIVTAGRQPQAPDKIEATFLSVSATQKLPGNRDIAFSVDGKKLPIDETAKKDNGFLSGTGQVVEFVSFYLTPAQAKTIIKGQEVLIGIGSSDFKIDQPGLLAFRSYIDEVDKLPPASSSFVRSCAKFMSKLPSLVSIISTVCEYVVIGSFAILVAASIAVCVMGLSRFIKM